MKTLTKTKVEFKINIHVDQITNCPHWIGDEDGLLLNYEMPGFLVETLPLEYLHRNGFSFYMTEEEQCEWLMNFLCHQEIYEIIAGEYGEDVDDFYKEYSCMDFSVSSFEMELWTLV